MIKAPSKPFTSDSSQEALRRAIIQARTILTPNRIMNFVRAYHRSSRPKYSNGEKVTFSEKALRNFADGITLSLTKEHYDYLDGPLRRSQFGRAMRSLEDKSRSEIDKMLDTIEHGKPLCPPSVNYIGIYFMYYGSYVESERLAVRVIEISEGDGHTIKVEDTIRDLIADNGRRRVSHGTLTFFKGYPQIILMPNEHNEAKVGLTLMVGNEPFVDQDGHVEYLVGSFLTLTKGGINNRYWRMVHEPDGIKEAMIEQSGAFLLDEIETMDRHRAAFQALRRQLPKASPDPIIAYRDGA